MCEDFDPLGRACGHLLTVARRFALTVPRGPAPGPETGGFRVGRRAGAPISEDRRSGWRGSLHAPPRQDVRRALLSGWWSFSARASRLWSVWASGPAAETRNRRGARSPGDGRRAGQRRRAETPAGAAADARPQDVSHVGPGGGRAGLDPSHREDARALPGPRGHAGADGERRCSNELAAGFTERVGDAEVRARPFLRHPARWVECGGPEASAQMERLRPARGAASRRPAAWRWLRSRLAALRARPRALALGGAALLLLASSALAWSVADGGSVARGDRHLADWIHRHRVDDFDALWRGLAVLGGGVVLGAAVAVMAVLAWRSGRRRLALFLGVAFCGAEALTWALKATIGRSRPLL